MAENFSNYFEFLLNLPICHALFGIRVWNFGWTRKPANINLCFRIIGIVWFGILNFWQESTGIRFLKLPEFIFNEFISWLSTFNLKTDINASISFIQIWPMTWFDVLILIWPLNISEFPITQKDELRRCYLNMIFDFSLFRHRTRSSEN